MPKKISVIWTIEKSQLETIVKNSKTYREVLSSIDFESKGDNNDTLRNRLNEDKIDYSHISSGSAYQETRKSRGLIPLDEITVTNSSYNRGKLKSRLIKEKILKNECYVCGLGPSWNNEKLVLQIDHINGIYNDNRIENLRIICPNCHSQTANFAGRARRLKPKITKERVKKISVPKIVDPNWRKAPKIWARKVERPSKEQLQIMLWEKPTREIAKDFGVADHSVAKWAKSYGLIKPGRGYWEKKRAGKI